MKWLALAGVALGAVACSATRDDARATSDALVALDASEILGEIAYGATQTVEVTPSPKYRAFWFDGERGDDVQITVTSLDATDPIVWLTDDQWNNIAENNDAKPTDTSSLIGGRYLSKTGKYYVVFREVYGAPQAKFAVSVRRLGVLPPDCDPDDEGTWDASCTDPLDYDPFDPASCAGDDLTAEQAKTLFGGPSGLRPSSAAVYYQTRQCTTASGGAQAQAQGAAPDCSPWVYAFAMDADIATIAPTPNVAGSYTFASASPRKTTIDVSVGEAAPADATKACLDGPFASGAQSATFGPTWSAFTDGSAGVCTSQLAALGGKLTATCARFALPVIQLGSGDPSHYTELSPVLYAQL